MAGPAVDPIAASPRSRRATVTYFGLMGGAAVIGFVKSLVFAKVLGVDDLAYWGLVLLVLQFGVYGSNMGILNGLNYELPVAYGRGEEAPERMAQSALGSIVVTTTIVACAYSMVVLAIPSDDQRATLALLLAAVLVAATTIAEFYVLMLRVRRQVIPLAITYLMRAAVALCLGAVAGALFGFVGVAVAELTTLAVVIAIASSRWLPPLRPRRPNLSQAMRLIRIGTPLAVSNLIVAGTYMTDRLFVATVLPDQFGQYTFASIVVTVALTLSGMIGQIVAPQILFEHGAGLSLRGVRARMLRITGIIAAGGLIGFGILLAVTEIARDGVFAEFAPGIGAMRILYVGGVFTVLNVYSIGLWAARRFVTVMATTALGLVVAVVGGLLITSGEPDLNAYAWLFVVAQGATTSALALAMEVTLRRSARQDAS